MRGAAASSPGRSWWRMTDDLLDDGLVNAKRCRNHQRSAAPAQQRLGELAQPAAGAAPDRHACGLRCAHGARSRIAAAAVPPDQRRPGHAEAGREGKPRVLDLSLAGAGAGNCSTASVMPFSPPAGPSAWPALSMPPWVLIGDRFARRWRGRAEPREVEIGNEARDRWPGASTPWSGSRRADRRPRPMSSGRTPASRQLLRGKGGDAGPQAVAGLVVVAEAGAMGAHSNMRPALRRAVGPRRRPAPGRPPPPARNREAAERVSTVIGRSEILVHGQRRTIDRGFKISPAPAPLRDGDVAEGGPLPGRRS